LFVLVVQLPVPYSRRWVSARLWAQFVLVQYVPLHNGEGPHGPAVWLFGSVTLHEE
jgi:hypothetical protein